MITTIDTLDEIGIDLSHVDIETHHSRQRWEAARREIRGIGGSSAAAALNQCRPDWGGPYALWLELARGIHVDRKIPNARNAEILENAIAEIYCEDTGEHLLRLPRWTIIRSRINPRLFFSPDFLIQANPVHGPGVFDAKTSMGFESAEEELDVEYRIQIEHALHVLAGGRTPFTFGTIGKLFGRKVLAWQVDWDDVRMRSLAAAEEEFLARVDLDEEPEMDSSGVTKKALVALAGPIQEKKVARLGKEFATLAFALRDLKAQEKALGREMDTISNRFLQAIGDAAEFTVDGLKKSGTFKIIHRRAYPVEASSYPQITIPKE